MDNVRRLPPQKIDELQYTYSGSRLLEVADSGNEEGFGDGADQAEEYSYDADGRLTADANKGLTITYNDLGRTYTRLGDFDKAAEYLNDSLEIRKKAENRFMRTL